MIGMIFNSVILGGVDVLGWRGYAIFSLILAIPMNIIGIVGAVKRRKVRAHLRLSVPRILPTSSSSRSSLAYSHTLFLPRNLTLRSSFPPLLISIHLIATLSFCSAQKFVYAYFLYSIVLAFMHTVSQIAWWVQLGQGKLKQPIVAECVRVLVHQGYSMLEAQQECSHIANIQLGVITACMFVGLVIQLYWTYVIRR